MHFTRLQSPIGQLLIVGDDAGLRRIEFGSAGRVDPPGDWIDDAAPLRDALDQLTEYFAGQRTTFDLPLAPVGTPFQLRCWAALRSIPFGQTVSYGEQARRIGDVNASRAVGAANGANPLPIVIPCHRVIGADGSLVGFGGGLDVKRALLEHEAAHAGLFAHS